MVFVQQDCPICGRKMFTFCVHCWEDYLSSLRDPAEMKPLERYLEVLFYQTRPEIIQLQDMVDRLEKLVGRPFRGFQGPASSSLADLAASMQGFEWLPNHTDQESWQQYAREAYNAYDQVPV